MKKQCIATTKSGTPCRTRPQQGSEFCYFHDPNRKEERLAASAAGGKAGKARTLPPDTPLMTLRTPADGCRLMEYTINMLLRDKITHQVANSVAIQLNLWLKAAELQIVAERLGPLEALDNGR
jgi:hypothetical protein